MSKARASWRSAPCGARLWRWVLFSRTASVAPCRSWRGKPQRMMGPPSHSSKTPSLRYGAGGWLRPGRWPVEGVESALAVLLDMPGMDGANWGEADEPLLPDAVGDDPPPFTYPL